MGGYRVFGGGSAASIVTADLGAAARSCSAFAEAAERGERLSEPWTAFAEMQAATTPSLGHAVQAAKRALAEAKRACSSARQAFAELGADLSRAAAGYAEAEHRAAVDSAAGWGSQAPAGLAMWWATSKTGRPPGLVNTAATVNGPLGMLFFPMGGPYATSPGGNISLLSLGTSNLLPQRISTGDAVAEEGPAPDSLDALLDLQAQAARGPGALLVTRVENAGETSWVVTVPSTNLESGSVWGLRRLPEALSGRTDNVAPAVVAALTAAGARPGEPVLLNGHSQGGRHAINLAGSETLRKDFPIKGVFTAAAPAGMQKIPDGIPVINLEDVDDTVPGADGHVDTPFSRDRLLIRSTPEFTHDDGGQAGFFGFEHRIGNYKELVKSSAADPAVIAMVSALRLGGKATTYRVDTRAAPVSRAAARGRAGGMKSGRR